MTLYGVYECIFYAMTWYGIIQKWVHYILEKYRYKHELMGADNENLPKSAPTSHNANFTEGIFLNQDVHFVNFSTFFWTHTWKSRGIIQCQYLNFQQKSEFHNFFSSA